MIRLDYSSYLKTITHPTLFLVGDSTEYEVLRMKDMEAQLPQA
ncbi:hypothetical protein [Paenibacillus graminis]|nr:hypothetical protein [Paenibacillus graminis]MEC0167324.1 hypothetical protein [Paenibacillus graminis]